MNPNDLIAQQQTLMNQLQYFYLIMFIVWVAGLLVTAWVLYMFYARLRDIGDELRKIRVMYEMEQERTIRSAAVASRAATRQGTPAGDAAYMPKQ